MNKLSAAICVILLLSLCGCGLLGSNSEATDDRESPFEQGEIAGLQTLISNKAIQEQLPESCPLEVAWTVPSFQSPASKIWLPPQELGLNYLLVLTEANDLLAFRRNDGAPLWWTKLGKNPPLGDPAFTAHSIYLIQDGNLLNLERHGGDVIWQLNLSFPPSPFMAVREAEPGKPSIFIASLNRVIYGLTVKENIWPPENAIGKVTRKDIMTKWHHLFTNWTFTTKGLIEGPITFREHLVYATDNERQVYCLDTSRIKVGHPTLAWRAVSYGPNTAGVLSNGQRIYVASRDRSLYSYPYNRTQGSWVYESGHILKTIPTAVTDPATAETSLLVLYEEEGPLVSISAADGKPLWSMDSGDFIAGLDIEKDAPPERRTALIIHQLDGTMQGVRFLSGDPLWDIPAGIFGLVAENNYAPGIFAFTKDGKTLCALTR